MSRSKGTFMTSDRWAARLAPTLPGAAGWVLLELSYRANYEDKAMTVADLMAALPYRERAVQQALAYLSAEGYVIPVPHEHAYIIAGSRTDLARAARTNMRARWEQKADQHKENPFAYTGITGAKREVREGIEESTDKKNPPTPQGDEAREGTAPALPEHQQEVPGGQERTLSPDGEAADAAVADLPDSSQVQVQHQTRKNGKATSTEKVPRRAETAFDPLPLALPVGVPADAWADWCAHRREIRKPLTERAARLTLAALETAAAKGWDAGQLIAEAITHGWTGCVFEKHRESAPQPARGHVVKFPPRRPQTAEEANARFTQNMAANADAVRGIFDD